LAQESTGGPSDEKALITYEKAQKALRERRKEEALDDFKKADKQDGGHCLACQKQMIKYGEELGEWKTAELGAEEIVAQAQGPKDTALAHYQIALVLAERGDAKAQGRYFFVRSPRGDRQSAGRCLHFPDACFVDGRALAQLKRDDEAKASFEEVL